MYYGERSSPAPKAHRLRDAPPADSESSKNCRSDFYYHNTTTEKSKIIILNFVSRFAEINAYIKYRTKYKSQKGEHDVKRKGNNSNKTHQIKKICKFQKKY